MPEGAPVKSSRTPLLAIGGVLLVALVVGGILRLTQGGSGDADTPPSPQDLPSDVVAVVEGAPASLETVTRVDFDRAFDQATVAADLKNTPKPDQEQYGELKETALRELLDAIWIQGQAAEMGISTSAKDIAAEREKLKKQAFKSDDQYREFLDESHFTKVDVDRRVKIQILSAEVQNKISERSGASEEAKQDAFADFVKRYETRWRSRTVCAPAFVVEHCSNSEKLGEKGGGNAAAPE